MSTARPTRPLEVIDLDTLDRARDRFPEDATYVVDGRLWAWEPVGCVLCVEADEPENHTLATCDDSAFYCLTHGTLVAVPYFARKQYEIRIGDVVRRGEETCTDCVLFPASLSETERDELIEQLLQEAEAEESAECASELGTTEAPSQE